MFPSESLKHRFSLDSLPKLARVDHKDQSRSESRYIHNNILYFNLEIARLKRVPFQSENFMISNH